MDRLRRLRQNAFVRHNTVFFIGSMAVAFLNYLYHPILSRLLSLSDFGEVQAIFSLSVQIGIILNVVGLVALNIEANKAHVPRRSELVADIQAVTFWVIFAFSLVLFLFSGTFTRIFHFDSPLPFIILIALLISNLPITFRKAYLQAAYDFTGLSIANAIMAGGRLAIAVGLVLVGFGVSGALGALVAAQLLAFWYLWQKTHRISSLRLWLRPRITWELIEELRYTLLTLVATSFVAFFTTADILFAKYYFDPAIAGSYSGISTIARIIYFATSSIAAVLLPSITLDQSRGEQVRVFMRSLFLLCGISAAALVMFYFFPTVVINLLIGAKFLPSASILSRLSVVTFLASIINLSVSYFLALRRYELLIVCGAGTAATIVPVVLWHATPLAMVNGFLVGSCATVGALTVLFIFDWYSNRGYDKPRHRT